MILAVNQEDQIGRKKMDIMEIILLVAGGVIFTLSFFIPDKRGTSGGKALPQEEIKALVEQEMATVGNHVDETVEEAVSFAMEKTERSLERLSNEKIMAVNEYSDTVLAEIRKNHEEVMFLYDMLNNKHTSLKSTVAEVNRAVKEAQETLEAMHRFADGQAAAEPAKGQGPVSSAERMPAVEPAQPLEEVSAACAGEVADAAGEDEQGRNNNERIMALYKRGKTATVIAKELGLGVGEVRLVIGLFRNQ